MQTVIYIFYFYTAKLEIKMDSIKPCTHEKQIEITPLRLAAYGNNIQTVRESGQKCEI